MAPAAIAVDAYIYLYPLVTMDITRLQMTNVPEDKAKGILGPMNEFHHFRAFPDVSFRTVVRPNFDTLYSTVWTDMTREPMIVSVPDSGGLYYLLPMLDMWTDVFASPGWRTTGTKAGHYAYVPPGWQGTLPKGVTRTKQEHTHPSQAHGSNSSFSWRVSRLYNPANRGQQRYAPRAA